MKHITRIILIPVLCSFVLNFTLDLPKNFGINFDAAMLDPYVPQQAETDMFWKLVKKSYDDFIINNLDYSETPRIPKIIHQVWVGPNLLPEKCKILRETWFKYHPDWEYKLWTNKEVAEFGLINQKQYDKATNWGEKADIARYEILNRYGGLYIDTDFECLQPFDIFHHCCNFYAGLGFGECDAVFIGLIGSAPNNPILEETIRSIKNGASNNPMSILDRTGPYLFARCVKKVLADHNDHYVLFPVTYFYPWPCYKLNENSREQIEKWFRPESFAVHHWHCSWMQ